MKPPVIGYERGKLTVLDQTLLPQQVVQVPLATLDQVEHAINHMQVRGAPLIGVTAAFGVCLAACRQTDPEKVQTAAGEAIQRLRNTRPTAVNLFWALDRMEHTLNLSGAGDLAVALETQARGIWQETQDQDRRMAAHGIRLLAPQARVITHCNTGPLATGGLGTALGVLLEGDRAWGGLHVYVDETRPRWQGGRLTTWELKTHGVDHTLICDSMAAFLMARGGIHSVWVGADRIAANGDTANKIGTYNLAIAAGYHRVPFYVVAPSTTIDPTLDTGRSIPIEERAWEEVAQPLGQPLAPQATPVWNPAFDVTPAELISAIITEAGVAHGPRYDLRRQPGASNPPGSG